MVLILCFSTLGLFFHFSKGVKYRYFFNKNITEEHILSVRHISNSKSINNRSCNFICKKIQNMKNHSFSLEIRMLVILSLN